MCILYNLSKLLPLFMNIVQGMAACNNAEYEINGECCPMCDPVALKLCRTFTPLSVIYQNYNSLKRGKRVYKHCDEYTSTTCDLCRVMTYTNTSNGMTECLTCSVCDTRNGLRVKQACTLISNTVCEPLPGYYCVDTFSSCKMAFKHSSCSPGQYINQTGTEFSDRVCGDCPAGSYSDGTLCKLHTKCEPLGKITIKEGTDTTDAVCSHRAPSYLLPLILGFCGVCLLLFIVIIVIIVKKKKAKNLIKSSYNTGFKSVDF